jgi:hypothetical protein
LIVNSIYIGVSGTLGRQIGVACRWRIRGRNQFHFPLFTIHDPLTY